MSAPTAARNAVAVAPGLRLTRRGRALLVLVLAAVLLTAFSLGRTGSQAVDVLGAAGAARAAAPTSTTVQPGDSLWTVAQRIAPEHDTREVVAQIQRLNGLDTATVQIGQLLLLPTSV